MDSFNLKDKNSDDKWLDNFYDDEQVENTKICDSAEETRYITPTYSHLGNNNYYQKLTNKIDKEKNNAFKKPIINNYLILGLISLLLIGAFYFLWTGINKDTSQKTALNTTSNINVEKSKKEQQTENIKQTEEINNNENNLGEQTNTQSETNVNSDISNDVENSNLEKANKNNENQDQTQKQKIIQKPKQIVKRINESTTKTPEKVVLPEVELLDGRIIERPLFFGTDTDYKMKVTKYSDFSNRSSLTANLSVLDYNSNLFSMKARLYIITSSNNIYYGPYNKITASQPQKDISINLRQYRNLKNIKTVAIEFCDISENATAKVSNAMLR